MRLLIFLLVLIFIAGCASTPYAPPIECEAGNSYILGTIKDVKALDRGLLTVQVAALETVDGYTALDAVSVLDQIEEIVDSAGTYAELVIFVTKKIEIANSLAGASIFILGDDISMLNSDTPLSKCDMALVRKHLAKQRMLLAFYAAG